LQRSNATIKRCRFLVRLAARSYLLYGGTNKTRGTPIMWPFIIACAVAGFMAIGAIAVLNGIQKPVDVAFTTSAVRI
jgi:hypothetical protein